MSVRSQDNSASTARSENRCATSHPAWCDRDRCTADPACQARGYRPGAGGEHRSAPVPLDLSYAMWGPGLSGEAYLTESVAPWRCSTYLHIRAGDTRIAMAVDKAAPVFSALLGLVMTAQGADGTVSL